MKENNNRNGNITNFKTWLTTFIHEKGIDRDQVLTVEGNSGTNHIPIGCLIDMMFLAPSSEQQQIKNMIVKIDFINGDVVHYFTHLAKAIAQ